MEARAVLTLTVDTSEGRRRFGVFADAAKDLTPVLREFDKYKRAKIADLFATGGGGKWPARSERSEQRGEARAAEATTRAPSTMLRKLNREYDRAAGKLERRIAKGATEKQITSGRNAVARRAFVLEAFQSAAQGIFKSADPKEQRLLSRLAPRWERAQARAASKGNLLGGLAQTVRSTIKAGTLTIDSSWDSPAPAALQYGGTVGNDATLPPREWLAWEPEDVDMLTDLFEQRALLAWKS